MAANTAPFKLDDAVATPSSEWAEATRAALEDKTEPSGTTNATSVPGGTAPVNTTTGTLPTGFALANESGHATAGPAATTTTGGPTATTDTTGATTGAPRAAPSTTGVPQAATFGVPAVVPQTPGLDIPGAYPSPHEAIPDSTVDTSAIAQDVSNMVQEARERLPAQEDFEKAAQDVAKSATALAHTATSYLPKSIADQVAALLPTARASENDAIHDKSLPTQETHGALPGEKVGGVGALPGHVDEAAVAKLPGDDAATGLPEGAVATLGAAAVAGAAGYAASSNDASHDKSLPTQETLGAKPGEKVEGVGALPGTANESGVAKLPGDDAATGLPTGSAGAAIGAVVPITTAVAATSKAESSSASSPHFQVPARPEDMVAKSYAWPDARSHGIDSKAPTATPNARLTGADPVESKDRSAGSKSEMLIPVAKGAGGAVPTQTTFSSSKPESAEKATPESAAKDKPIDDKAQGASLNAEHGKSKPSDAHSQSGTSAHTQGSKDEHKHKASFMEKVKGEIKVISGKLGGDKHKVDEGKKLKAGEI